MKYKVKVWVVVEEESEVDAAEQVEFILKNAMHVVELRDDVEIDVDWDSAEEVEDEHGLR